MIALGFNVGIDNLIVEKLRGSRPSRDAPLIVVEQPPEESKLALLVQHFNLHEVGKLAGECLHLLVQPRQLVLDLGTQQYLHAVVGELRPEFANSSGRIAEELRECRADAALRPRPFKDDGIEDFDLIEMVALRLKELSPLFDGGLY